MHLVKPSDFRPGATRAEQGLTHKTFGRRGLIAREKSPIKNEATYIHRREMFRKELAKFIPSSIFSFCLLIVLLCFGLGEGIISVIIGSRPLSIAFFGNVLIVIFLLSVTFWSPISLYIRCFKKDRSRCSGAENMKPTRARGNRSKVKEKQ